MSHKEAVYERLDGLGIPYERHEHALVHTMADCLALPYAAPDVTFCKNILLCNRQQTLLALCHRAFETLPHRGGEQAAGHLPPVLRPIGAAHAPAGSGERLPQPPGALV